jgi:hypothetical protein
VTPTARCGSKERITIQLVSLEEILKEGGSEGGLACVLITTGPSTKLFTWGGGGYGILAIRDREHKVDQLWLNVEAKFPPLGGLCVYHTPRFAYVYIHR